MIEAQKMACAGCGELVNAWRINGIEVIRERQMGGAEIHVCADPEQRERVDLPFPEIMAFRCEFCGDRDCAPSNWGRVVVFPSDPDLEMWAEGWVGLFQEHVCLRPESPQTHTEARDSAAPRPVWEAFA